MSDKAFEKTFHESTLETYCKQTFHPIRKTEVLKKVHTPPTIDYHINENGLNICPHMTSLFKKKKKGS